MHRSAWSMKAACRAALGLLLWGWAGGAVAQIVTAAPGRNANIWNGQKHEPDAGTVTDHERALGIASPEQQQRDQDQELERRAQTLIDQAHTALPAPRPVPPKP